MIADAVTAFSAERDLDIAGQQQSEAQERLGFLVRETRNAVGTAMLAASALEKGNVAMSGATGSVLKRSLAVVVTLTNRLLEDVRLHQSTASDPESISVTLLLSEASRGVESQTALRGCSLHLHAIDPQLHVRGTRHLLLGALDNLLQNAFEFSQPTTEVALSAEVSGELVLIEDANHCGRVATRKSRVALHPVITTHRQVVSDAVEQVRPLHGETRPLVLNAYRTWTGPRGWRPQTPGSSNSEPTNQRC